jgi:hypothetical protein
LCRRTTSLRPLGDASANRNPEEQSNVVDIVSLITLQGRSRRNALRAARLMRRERQEAAEARTALNAAGPAPTFADTQPKGDFR